ncbi:alpha/beta hydrolase [Curtobacterium flaccumfaciens pv. oortii]|uniref:alpha/beta fold hydrolase n=1 Tax=Curtobacterium flaccumfaciens TaxID=2035 RepID=UPI001BDE635F|nr:alpha/beta hydrolase [Curtobacterium flaccumfaciens]MBT1621890.1 alpha/beta hydrolase [Curtobacterium flaccumfaciens pv. oortii]
MTTSPHKPSVIFIAGHWLGAWAWDAVIDEFTPERWRPVAMTLPGLDPDDGARATRTLSDQVAAIVSRCAQLGVSRDQPVVIVAHSGANGPVSMFIDRHADLVRRVVWVDSGPRAAGSAFAVDLPDDVAELPLPPFDQLAGQASLEGLSAAHLERFRDRAVPEPAPVLQEPVELLNEERKDVPTTLVCCSLSSAQVLELAHEGHPMFAPVAELDRVEVVDLPTGHWPMWSRPRDLARVIAEAVAGPERSR